MTKENSVLEIRKTVEKSPEDLSGLIQNAVNQFARFQACAHRGIEEIRKVISKTDLKTLEEYTGKTTKELNNTKRGICGKYNSMIKEFKNPDLTLNQFAEIMEKVWTIKKTPDIADSN